MDSPSMSTIGFREEIVRLSKALTPELFFITIWNNPEGIQQLQRRIDDWCCTDSANIPSLGSIKIGSDCFAFSTVLKKWCRASLLSVQDDFGRPSFPFKRPHADKLRPNIVTQAMTSVNKHSGDVELYDYGGTERVAYSNLRPPLKELFDQEVYPHLALKCSLHGVKPRGEEWSERAINSFNSYCFDRRLKLIIKETIGDLHMVDLMQYDLDDVPFQNASVRELLVFTNEARLLLNDIDETRFTTNPLITFRSPRQLDLTGCKMVLVTSLVSPDLFYVTRYSGQEKFQSLQERLTVYFDLPEEAYTVYCPKKNLPCVALSEDGSYYRALIKQVKSDQVEVEFVDIGSVQVIPTSNLRLIRNEFLSIPIQAIPCKLAGVAPAHGLTWSKTAIKKFQELVFSDHFENNQILNLNVVSYEDSRRHVVTLRRFTGNEYISLNKALVDLKLAISTDPSTQASSQVTVPSQYQDPRSRFDIKVFSQLKDFDVCGFNILTELVKRNSEARSSKIDSLIKIHMSHWVSPSKFYVQIMTPEVKSYFICYENNLSDNHKHLINQTLPASLYPLNIGDTCLYIIQEDFSAVMKRAIIVDRQPDDDDPLFDSPSTLYTVFARDYGFTVQVERKFIRELASDSEYLKDGDFCIRCHLSEVVPAGGGDWTKTAIEEFALIVNKYRSQLHLSIESKFLPAQKPHSLGVDIFAKEVTIVDALAPKRTKFHSFKNLIINRGVAIPIKGASLSDDEEEPDPSCSTTSPRPTNMPYSLKSRSSIISYLKGGHHRINEKKAAEVQFYQEPERPKCEQFIAISSEVDLKMKIWFRIWEMEGGQPIDIVNRNITQTLRDKDELTPFIGDALFNRACSAYFTHDKTWNRAQIILEDRDGFVIQYVDYGNMDRVSAEHLSSDVFNLEIPKLALHGYLFGCRPIIDEENDETLRDTIHQLIVDKKCVICWENFKSPDDMKISVVLPDGRSLKDILIEKNLVVEDYSLEQHIPAEMRIYLDLIESSEYTASTILFERDVYYPIAVTGNFMSNYVFIQHLFIDSPRLTNVEKAINERNDRYLLTLETMRTEISLFSYRDSYKPGDCCCVQFSDKEWYRGLVIEVTPDGEYKILYVDYGNTDTVGIEELRQLPSKYFQDIQIHAIPVRICNIRPAQGGPWNKRLLKHMDKIALAHSEDTLALFKNTEPPWEVELYIADPANPRKPRQSFFQPLIDSGEMVAINFQYFEEENLSN